MAGSTSNANVKHIKEGGSQQKESQHFSKQLESELNKKEGKKHSAFELMRETLRYEKYCKYWSILSNIAAVVSVTGAVMNIMKNSVDGYNLIRIFFYCYLFTKKLNLELARGLVREINYA